MTLLRSCIARRVTPALPMIYLPYFGMDNFTERRFKRCHRPGIRLWLQGQLLDAQFKDNACWSTFQGVSWGHYF